MTMINVYACGGCGCNISKQIKNADININYIDTSDSNLKNFKNNDNVYIVEGLDGAGKDRSKTYNHFKDIASDIIIRFKPSDKLNIVISSLSGGSGSVIAPLITRELISNDYTTICIGINSKNSIKEIDNTIKTLKTYKSISSLTNKPVGLYYINNEDRKESDKIALMFVDFISMLLNKEITEEFDTTDLHNFINFDKVTEYKADVGVIEINENKDFQLEKDTTIVSTILVTKNKESTIEGNVPGYLATCVINDSQYNENDVRMDNVLGKLALIVNTLENELNRQKESIKLNKIKNLEVEGNEDGIVL